MVFYIRKKLQQQDQEYERTDQPYLPPAPRLPRSSAPPSRSSFHVPPYPPFEEEVAYLISI